MQDKVSFATREEIGIQAADLVAREAMKLMDNQLTNARPTRLSAQVLIDSQKIEFKQYRKRCFENLLEGAMLSETAYSREEYNGWLIEHKVQDTVENRIKYESTRQDLQEKMKKLFDESNE